MQTKQTRFLVIRLALIRPVNRNTIFSGVDMGRPFFISCEIWGTANKVSEIITDICGKIDIDNFSINPFSDGIENVCIVVNCHPDENLIRGWGKPRKYINYQKRYADIRYQFLMLNLFRRIMINSILWC